MAKDSVVRGLRDEAAVGPDPTRARDLKRLSELRYEVAAGEPDIRGWTVFSSTGREVGTVADLLVDTDAGEVVMLDVDLRRHDQHTLAPIRAAWVDHATRRVVLDARALAGAMTPSAESPAAGAPTAGALGAGASGVGAARVGAAETGPVDATAQPPASRPAIPAGEIPIVARTSEPSGLDTGAGVPALPRSGPLSDADVARFNDDYIRAYGDRAADQHSAWRVTRGTDEALQFAPRRLLDESPARAVPTPVVPPSATPGAISDAERRASRVDDASALDEDAGIDPRELDARVRIEEGATVDEASPVAGVRYDGAEHTPHDYGQPADAYGPEYGSGRIGFNRVVTREPLAPGAEDASAEPPREATRAVRYRQYDDRYAGPDDRR